MNKALGAKREICPSDYESTNAHATYCVTGSRKYSGHDEGTVLIVRTPRRGVVPVERHIGLSNGGKPIPVTVGSE